MTRNQIMYQELQQTIRRDAVNAEIGRGTLRETIRHNLATEGETASHNRVVEAQAYRQLEINAIQAEAQRYNAETNRLNYQVNLYNAETNRYNAETNRLNYQVNLYNAETNRLNYGVNLMNAESNRISANAAATGAAAAMRQAAVAERNAATNEYLAKVAYLNYSMEHSYKASMVDIQRQNANTQAKRAETELYRARTSAAVDMTNAATQRMNAQTNQKLASIKNKEWLVNTFNIASQNQLREAQIDELKMKSITGWIDWGSGFIKDIWNGVTSLTDSIFN